MINLEMSKKVAVVIPCYKEQLTPYEQVALRRCREILNDHPVVFVTPDGLTLPAETTGFKDQQTFCFDKSFFSGIAGYNALMLSSEFYRRFSNFEYLLIYQLDAFVFTDELLQWCNKNYDYIGAPWLARTLHTHYLKRALLHIQRSLSYRLDLKKRGVPNKYQFENRVGNGGLSLRRVSTFYRLCEEMKDTIAAYLLKDAHQYNEDAFWGLEANRVKKQLAIPGWREALHFAFEKYPANALKLTGGQLPFACHDWDNYPEFWRPVFKEFGYDI